MMNLFQQHRGPMRVIFFLTMALMVISSAGYSLSIAEKKASLSSGGTGDLSKDMQRFLIQVNQELKEQHTLLKSLYTEVRELYRDGASDEDYQNQLDQINQVKDNIQILQTSWQEMAVDNNQSEEYALWHQPDTTLGDLVIDYGSQDYVYLMAEEIEDLPLSVNSNIPIPRSAWTDMLEMILTENGIGIKQLNPFLRQLIFLKQDNSNVQLITNDRADLEVTPSDARVCFVLSPKADEVNRAWFFLEKFVNPNSSEIQLVGRDILIIAPVNEVRELLKLYEFVEESGGNLEYRVVPLRRVDAEEMTSVLNTIFNQLEDDFDYSYDEDVSYDEKEKRRSPKYKGNNGLKVIPLANVSQALYLIGTSEEINKAQDIIYQVEAEIGEARERVVYTYQSKHTDSAELADILDRVYNMMVVSRAGVEQEIANVEEENQGRIKSSSQSNANTEVNLNDNLLSPEQIYNPGHYQDGSYVINSDLIQPGSSKQGNPDPNKGRNNFIVDVKTGSIVMVLESIYLPKLKELIRKLDVPKKAVQIEVLLFEKQTDKNGVFGLNLLRLGDKASNTDVTALSFNNINPIGSASSIGNRGILEFCLSRVCGTSGIAAYDLAYRFLLSRDDVTINSNPSVVAINQTTATIEVKEQFSLNTGTLLVDSTGGAIPNNQFVREEYGITIKVTPTIHMRDEEVEWGVDEPNYITLESDITFDTIKPSTVDRPDVTRRHIVNETRIADGQTVIIGGLRRKEAKDFSEKIPLLGELPGIGKLFSDTRMEDSSREMFIFITPKIIVDPSEDMERLKYQQLCRRPGVIPAFLGRLDRARENEKKRLFEGYMNLILGQQPSPLYCPPGEYDGRCR